MSNHAYESLIQGLRCCSFYTWVCFWKWSIQYTPRSHHVRGKVRINHPNWSSASRFRETYWKIRSKKIEASCRGFRLTLYQKCLDFRASSENPNWKWQCHRCTNSMAHACTAGAPAAATGATFFSDFTLLRPARPSAVPLSGKKKKKKFILKQIKCP